MSIQLDPGEHRPYRLTEKVRAAEVRQHWRLASDGIELIAHGALICPSCDAPLLIATAISARERLSCGFCGHRARARQFLSRDVFDTLANEAYLIARLG